ncbi:nitrate- and nitrite sensing domain-containing protein [Streptomyces sp. NPDC006368]|uniref:sensor histidine kinase n=1 Tax=Streptomyces sp. NPDC006368 TaxID=3156760 RepID=UPI0033ADA507
MRRSKNSAAEQQARGNFTPPPRTAAPPADAPGTPSDGPAAGTGSTSRLSPRNWRVPTRLNAILLIPVLVGLVMGGFQVSASIDTWNEAEDAEKTALVVRAASEYGQALLDERDLTALPLLTAKSAADREADVIKQAHAKTDAAKRKFDIAVQSMPDKPGLQRRLKLFRAEEPGLEELRETAYTRGKDPVFTEEGYVKVQHSLMEFSNELGLGTGNITSYGRTVYAVQLAKAAESLQRSIGMHLLVRPSKDDAVFARQSLAFNSYNYLEQIAIGEYVSGGTAEDTEKLQQVMAGKAAEGAKKLQEANLNPPAEKGSVFTGMALAIGQAKDADEIKALREKDVTPETWMGAATAKFEGYSEIEAGLVTKAVDEAEEIANDARTDAFVTGGLVVVALFTAFLLAGMMARQMSTSMRRLRTAAFTVAEQRLPMLVDQLSRTDPGRVDTRVEPIPINSQDEIGEVARAFDQVHREAVRLAAEQALLRGNVNAIFTNLSQRNQSLIEGQLTLITDLENNEADPDQLENLFKLDHLATRMRRNGENLLILAGEEPGRRWNQPVPLVDVLRAASSEVEQYERIELTGVPESEIHGQAVTDLVHLLAELLENATTFSSPQTKVRVTATRLPDGRVMVEIHDKGIGLTAEDFADINHKLANPPTVDAAISQRMGLFVVGRLADRHGIRVQLRPSGEQAGTTSLVMLPDAITHGGGGDPALNDDFTVSSIIPEQQAYEAAPVRTAAELGFDDSRYEQPSSDTPLDPVGRSLIREGRRQALGAQLFRDEGDQQQPQGAYGQQQYEQQPQQEQYGQYEPQEQPYGAQEQYDTREQYDAQSSYPQGDYPQQYGDQYAGQEYATGEYPEPSYAEPAFADREPQQSQYDNQFDTGAHQGDWSDQGSYSGAYDGSYAPESESAQGAPANGRESVGFSSGPAPSAGHALTDAGLPRRGSSGNGSDGGNGNGGSNGSRQHAPQQEQPQPQQGGQQHQQQSPSTQPAQQAQQSEDGSDSWRSTNDERWQRAEKLREPKAGGVTPSGLPRRVPKANLIEGTAEQTPQGGPQVSRSPEDVRGRLSNLRRGVQQGRSAGTDTNGPGHGPGSTYNQER